MKGVFPQSDGRHRRRKTGAVIRHHGAASGPSRCPMPLLSLSDGPLIESAAALGAQTTVLTAPAALQALGDSQVSGKRHWVMRSATLVWGGFSSSRHTWKYARALRRQIKENRPRI